MHQSRLTIRLLLAALGALVGALLVGTTLSTPASAAAWPAGCKVSSNYSAPYVNVYSLCPSDRHQVIAWCTPNGSSTAYPVYGNVANPGQNSGVQCRNSRLVRTDLILNPRSRG